MGFNDSARSKVMNSKTGVGVGMALVGLIAAGSVVRSRHQREDARQSAAEPAPVEDLPVASKRSGFRRKR